MSNRASWPDSGRAPGDFCVCRISGAGGALIDFGEWLNGAKAFSHWDHALVYVGNGKVLQAEPGGAQIVERPVWAGDLWSTGLPGLELAPAQQDAVGTVANALRGTPYSWADYAALALHRLHIPAPHLRAYVRTSGHLICSQLVDRVRNQVGSHLFNDGRWEGDVTPYDLGVVLKAAGAVPVGS